MIRGPARARRWAFPPRCRGADGDAYFAAADRLYRWRLKDDTYMPVAICPGCTMLTEASPGLWLLADAASIYRVRLARDKPATDAH